MPGVNKENEGHILITTLAATLYSGRATRLDEHSISQIKIIKIGEIREVGTKYRNILAHVFLLTAVVKIGGAVDIGQHSKNRGSAYLPFEPQPMPTNP